MPTFENKWHSYRSGTRSAEGAEIMHRRYVKLRLCIYKESRIRCFSDVWPIFWPWKWYSFPINFGHNVHRVISFPTVYRTSKSMQPFGKCSRLKLAHLRQSRGCTKISVQSVIIHRFRNFFTDVFQTYVQTTLPLEVLHQKLQLRLLSFESGETHFSRFFHVFEPPNGGRGQVGRLIFVSLESPYPLS